MLTPYDLIKDSKGDKAGFSFQDGPVFKCSTEDEDRAKEIGLIPRWIFNAYRRVYSVLLFIAGFAFSHLLDWVISRFL